MYTIEFDNVDPTNLGFEPKEVKRKSDGTYFVERKQFQLSVWNSGNDPIGGEGWCPCSHEIIDKRRLKLTNRLALNKMKVPA